jgi:hypothetical protein
MRQGIFNKSARIFLLFATLALSCAVCFAEAMNDEIAVVGGGCFWCVEAVYQGQAGIKSVVSGYAAGKNPNPTYEEVCTGQSGHAGMVIPAVAPVREQVHRYHATHEPAAVFPARRRARHACVLPVCAMVRYLS